MPGPLSVHDGMGNGSCASLTIIGPFVQMLRVFQKLNSFFKNLPWSQQLLLAMAICAYFISGIYLGLPTRGADFTGFHQAAVRIVTGQGADIYQEFFTVNPVTSPFLFGYAPPVAVLFAPLGYLRYQYAWLVFQGLLHICLWAALWLAIRETRDRGIQEPAFCSIIGVLLFFPVYYSLWLGQCELLILLLLFAAMRLSRHKHFLLAGLALAISIWLKIFLGLVLVYFLMVKRWRLLFSCVLSLVAIEVVSSIFIPIETQLQFWRAAPEWTRKIQPFLDNFAVSGPLYRLLTFNDYTHGIGQYEAVARVLTMIFSGAIFVTYLRHVRLMPIEDFGWGFSYTIITALLISPLTDTHHLVFLLIPFLFYAINSKGLAGLRLFYGFFAVYIPFVAFKFLSVNRLRFFFEGFYTIVLSLAFFVLFALWIYVPRVVQRTK